MIMIIIIINKLNNNKKKLMKYLTLNYNNNCNNKTISNKVN